MDTSGSTPDTNRIQARLPHTDPSGLPRYGETSVLITETTDPNSTPPRTAMARSNSAPNYFDQHRSPIATRATRQVPNLATGPYADQNLQLRRRNSNSSARSSGSQPRPRNRQRGPQSNKKRNQQQGRGRNHNPKDPPDTDFGQAKQD